MSKFTAVPVHKPSVAVTVIFAICCVETFAAVKDGIVPVPLVVILPVEELLKAQLKVTPEELLVKLGILIG